MCGLVGHQGAFRALSLLSARLSAIEAKSPIGRLGEVPMSETFRGPNGKVKFSSAATEALYQAWVTFGREIAKTESEFSVADWREKRLVEGSDGSRAFSLNPPPPALATPEKLHFLVTLSQKTRSMLATPDVASELSERIVWTDQRRADWCTRLITLEELLAQAAASVANR
jgi:hypothetical protein